MLLPSRLGCPLSLKTPNMGNPGYAHWQPGVPHPTLGDQIQKLAERNYIAEDYIAETRNANVTQAVHVQAAIGSPDPVTETEWLQKSWSVSNSRNG